MKIQTNSSDCQDWLEAQQFDKPRLSAAEFEGLARSLLKLGAGINWEDLLLFPANKNEERLLLLAQVGYDGPALYWVSDGPGVASPAHSHETWAVIAGLAGIERNTLYRVVAPGRREVTREQSIDVGAGEFLCLSEADIHATEVIDSQATCHLHLYGKPLQQLPPFESRTFEVLANES